MFDHGIIVGNIQDGEHYFGGSNSFSFFLDNNNKGILWIYEFWTNTLPMTDNPMVATQWMGALHQVTSKLNAGQCAVSSLKRGTIIDTITGYYISTGLENIIIEP